MTPATILEHDGIKQPITEWALDYGITPGIIIGRLERGVTIADAINTPMKTGHRGQRLPIFSKQQIITTRRKPRTYRAPVNAKKYTYQGRTLTVHEWSRLTGLKPTTIGSRIRKGWSVERTLTATRFAQGRPGVASDFAPSEGTGAGSTLQESTDITFSGIDA